MIIPIKKILFTRLHLKLLGLFTVIAVIPPLVSGGIVFIKTQGIIKKQIFSTLKMSVEDIENDISLSLGYKKTIALNYSSDGLLKDGLIRYDHDDPDVKGLVRRINYHLLKNKLPLDPDLEDILLLDLKGRVVFASNDKWLGKDKSRKDYFLNVSRYFNDGAMLKKLKRNPRLAVYMSDFYVSDDLKAPILAVSNLVTATATGLPLGVLVNRYKGDLIYKRVGSEGGVVGVNRQIYIVNKDGLLLTIPGFLKGKSGVILKERIESQPVVKAQKYQSGMLGIYKNSQGIKVLGASTIMPEKGWIILTEQGLEDAFYPLYNLTLQIFIIVFIATAVAVVLSLIIASVQESLQESKDFSQSLLQAIPFGMDIVDEEGNVIFMNQMLESILGSGAVGRKCWLLYKDDKTQCLNCPLKRRWTSQPGEIGVIETTGVLGGKVFQINHTSMVYKGREALLEIFQDITYRKKAEEEIRKLSRAIEESPTTVMITDAKGRIEYVNHRFTQLTGYGAKEVIGKNPSILRSGQMPQEVYEGLWKTLRAGSLWRGEFINKKKNGQLYYESASISSLKNSLGEISNFILVAEDVSELKTAQSRLIQAEKLEVVGTLASGVAHEVKNPLAIILQGIDYLSATLSAKDENVSASLQYMLEAVKRADNVIRGLLDFSALSELNIEPQDLNSVIDKSLLLLKHQLDKYHIQVAADFKNDIPAVKIDKNRIEQVCVNLILNAVQAIIPGSGELKLRTYLEELPGQGAWVVFQVEDSGTGIPRDVLEKIFDPFFTTKRSTGGTGLGLSVVKNIVNMHNGKIKIENKKEGRGVIATVMFKA